MDKEQEIKLKVGVFYDGHNIKNSGIVNLRFSADYTELVNVVPLVQLLNNDILLAAKVDKKIYKLGSFRLNSIKINSDGKSDIKFNSIIDDVEPNNFNMLIEKEAPLDLLIKSTVILEGVKKDV